MFAEPDKVAALLDCVRALDGEGIAYAMESGELAAEVISQALVRPPGAARERVLQSYPTVLDDRYGGYFTVAQREAGMRRTRAVDEEAHRLGVRVVLTGGVGAGGQGV